MFSEVVAIPWVAEGQGQFSTSILLGIMQLLICNIESEKDCGVIRGKPFQCLLSKYDTH